LAAVLLAGCSGVRAPGSSGPEGPFKTSELQYLLATASARDHLPRLASPLDLELMRAAGAGDASEVAKLLARGAQADAADAARSTALLVAAREGRREVVRLLLAAGADVDGRGGAMTPLAAAALRGHLQVAALLLRHGADVDAAGAGGLPALMNAVKINRLDIAALVLQAKPDLRIYDHDGKSLVAVAVANNNTAMVALLVRSGARSDLPSRSRWGVQEPAEPPRRAFELSLLPPALSGAKPTPAIRMVDSRGT